MPAPKISHIKNLIFSFNSKEHHHNRTVTCSSEKKKSHKEKQVTVSKLSDEK